MTRGGKLKRTSGAVSLRCIRKSHEGRGNIRCCTGVERFAIDKRILIENDDVKKGKGTDKNDRMDLVIATYLQICYKIIWRVYASSLLFAAAYLLGTLGDGVLQQMSLICPA
jgi:hypothetical protein